MKSEYTEQNVHNMLQNTSVIVFLCIFYCVGQWQFCGFVCMSHCVTVAVIVFGTFMQKESCELAWNLLVGQYGLNPSRLYVTYFGGDRDLGLGPDLETRDIWRQIG